MYPDVLVEVDNTQELVVVRRGAVGKWENISKTGLKEVEKKSYHGPSTASQAPLQKSMMVKIPACVRYEVRKRSLELGRKKPRSPTRGNTK